jgi:hypothetical protein
LQANKVPVSRVGDTQTHVDALAHGMAVVLVDGPPNDGDLMRIWLDRPPHPGEPEFNDADDVRVPPPVWIPRELETRTAAPPHVAIVFSPVPDREPFSLRTLHSAQSPVVVTFFADLTMKDLLLSDDGFDRGDGNHRTIDFHLVQSPPDYPQDSILREPLAPYHTLAGK